MKFARLAFPLPLLLALAGCEEQKPKFNYNTSHSPHIITLTGHNFQTVVLKNDKPVLVDFYADWCGPCKALEPALNAIEHQYHGQLVVARINVDDNRPIASMYAVSSIPLLLMFKDGKMIGVQEGLPPDDGSGDLVQSQLTAVAKMLSVSGPQQGPAPAPPAAGQGTSAQGAL